MKKKRTDINRRMFMVISDCGNYQLFDKDPESKRSMINLYNTAYATRVFEVTIEREIEFKVSFEPRHDEKHGVDKIPLET